MAVVTQKDIEVPIGGLFLMIIFTCVWILITEYSLNFRDYGAVVVGFGVVLAYLAVHYVRFYFAQKELPEGSEDAGLLEKRREKWFLLIFIIEGLVIFVTWNVLFNLKWEDYFIPCVGLIVGLHFFPLAAVFRRPFEYVVAVWTVLVSAVALLLLVRGLVPKYMAVAIVGVGCALGTSVNGIRMVRMGERVLKGG